VNGITGANQNYDTYWQRVKLAFDERKIVDPYFNKTVMIRGEKAMGTHWGIMQAACSRWHGIQEEIEARPLSGTNFEAKASCRPSTQDRRVFILIRRPVFADAAGVRHVQRRHRRPDVQVPQRLRPHRELQEVDERTPEPREEQGQAVRRRRAAPSSARRS
jgi:hypothetical protein